MKLLDSLSPFDRLLDLIPWRGDELVLDVGFGRGDLLASAAKRLTTGLAIGLDLSHVNDGINVGRVTAIRGDARNLPFVSHIFDRVFSTLVLHHLNPSGGHVLAVQEMARVLKPGGIIILSGEQAGMLMESGITRAKEFRDPIWSTITLGYKERLASN